MVENEIENGYEDKMDELLEKMFVNIKREENLTKVDKALLENTFNYEREKLTLLKTKGQQNPVMIDNLIHKIVSFVGIIRIHDNFAQQKVLNTFIENEQWSLHEEIQKL